MTSQTGRRKVSAQHPDTFASMWVVARGALPSPARKVREWGRRGLDDRVSMAIRTEGVSLLHGRKRVLGSTDMTVFTSATGEGLVYGFAEEALS